MPINGTSNYAFKDSVKIDENGKFTIKLISDEAAIIKLKISNQHKGVIVVEPSNEYNVTLDLNSKEKAFVVEGENNDYQNYLNTLPNPVFVQIMSYPYLNDTTAANVKKAFQGKLKLELDSFSGFYQRQQMSKEVFDLIKTDRVSFYDGSISSVIYIKQMRYIRQEPVKSLEKDFVLLWDSLYQNSLLNDKNLIKSRWYSEYLEGYLYYKEYKDGKFTAEIISEFGKSINYKDYSFQKIQEHLPYELHEHYKADRLYFYSLQKNHEKELIKHFSSFTQKYPGSLYTPYLKPLLEEIELFQKEIQKDLSNEIQFVEDYDKINSLQELVGKFTQEYIFIDTWAIWCGPCKAEFKHKDSLNLYLQEKNIPLLYISIDDAKDSINWINNLKFYNLTGSHVRASEPLAKDLARIYDMEGAIAIPWYMLLDNKGNVLIKHATAPSNFSALKAQIEEHINK